MHINFSGNIQHLIFKINGAAFFPVTTYLHIHELKHSKLVSMERKGFKYYKKGYKPIVHIFCNLFLVGIDTLHMNTFNGILHHQFSQLTSRTDT